MSFYIRKSLRAGPLRFNLSKSGIGVSAGITGFRIGTGPRGNYVHIGRGGLYYRRTITSRPSTATRETHQRDIPNVQMKGIESVDVLELRDSSSAELLAEINSKHKKVRILPIVVFSSLIVWSLFFVVMAPSTIGQLGNFGTIFLHLGTVLLFLITAALIFFAYRHDQLSKTVVLFYELDGDAESAYQTLHHAFEELVNCSRAWQIRAQGRIQNLHEWKRQAGADALIERRAARLAYKAPPYISTNLAIPAISAGQKSLYLFPDRILVYEKGKVGAVSYMDMQLSAGNSNFIEAEAVPPDTKVVGYTWRFVNKDGSPDRRFNNNRQLPIARYSELHFTSQTGLNELFQISKTGAGTALVEALKKLALIASVGEGLSPDKVLRHAINAIKLGERKAAYQLLLQVIKANPRDKNAEKAWLWMSEVVVDPERKRQCFETVLKLNPDNTIARKALSRIASDF